MLHKGKKPKIYQEATGTSPLIIDGEVVKAKVSAKERFAQVHKVAKLAGSTAMRKAAEKKESVKNTAKAAVNLGKQALREQATHAQARADAKTQNARPKVPKQSRAERKGELSSPYRQFNTLFKKELGVDNQKAGIWTRAAAGEASDANGNISRVDVHMTHSRPLGGLLNRQIVVNRYNERNEPTGSDYYTAKPGTLYGEKDPVIERTAADPEEIRQVEGRLALARIKRNQPMVDQAIAERDALRGANYGLMDAEQMHGLAMMIDTLERGRVCNADAAPQPQYVPRPEGGGVYTSAHAA